MWNLLAEKLNVRETYNKSNINKEENMMQNMSYDEYCAMMLAVGNVMDSRLVEVCEETGHNEEDVKFGVNWSSCGTQSIKETKKFAEKINKACRIAEKLNAMEIKVNYDEKITKEEYRDKVHFYTEMFKNI